MITITGKIMYQTSAAKIIKRRTNFPKGVSQKGTYSTGISTATIFFENPTTNVRPSYGFKKLFDWI
jgi:hypothetical protein